MRIRGIGICLALLIAASNGYAQSTFGAIVGAVKDPSNSVVGKATVKITNADENMSRQVLTTTDGSYEALNLKPGRYNMTVTHPGFQAERVKDIQLIARQTIRVDITLKVGSVEQTVAVEASTGVISSETDTIASSYGSERILTLPTNLRASTSTSPYFTITTLPGVQSDDSGYLKIQGALPNQSQLSVDCISAQH